VIGSIGDVPDEQAIVYADDHFSRPYLRHPATHPLIIFGAGHDVNQGEEDEWFHFLTLNSS
jgi:hypothetical protein